MSRETLDPNDNSIARENALRAEFDIGTDDLDVLKHYCTQYCDVRIDKEKIHEFQINSNDWSVKDEKVNKVLDKVKQIVPLLSVFAKNFKHLLHALHATRSQTKEDLHKTLASYARDGLKTNKKKQDENGKMELVKGFHVTDVLSRQRMIGPPDQIHIDAVRRIVWALVDPFEALQKIKAKIATGCYSSKQQVRYDNESIISNLVIIHAVTLNCAEYFHGLHCEDSFRYYQQRK